MNERESFWQNEFMKIFQRYSDDGWTATIGYPWQTVEWVFQKTILNFDSVVPEEILLVFNFLCEYRKEAAAALTFNMCTDTYRSCLWRTCQRINKSLPNVCFHSSKILLNS